MKIPDTLGFLVGTWELQRSILDHRSRIAGSFAGSAVISMADGAPGALVAARYVETGQLSFGAYTGEASRALEYRSVTPSEVMIHFADGRPFVDLDLRGGRWRSVHYCGEDVYVIATIVHSEVSVEEIWQVRGPTKSYDATTTLTRAGVGTGPLATSS